MPPGVKCARWCATGACCGLTEHLGSTDHTAVRTQGASRRREGGEWGVSILVRVLDVLSVRT